MVNKPWNARTTRIFLATYSAAFISIAAMAILKINLLKIANAYISIIVYMLRFTLDIIHKNRPNAFEFLTNIVEAPNMLNANELVAFFVIPIILLLIQLTILGVLIYKYNKSDQQ